MIPENRRLNPNHSEDLTYESDNDVSPEENWKLRHAYWYKEERSQYYQELLQKGLNPTAAHVATYNK